MTDEVEILLNTSWLVGLDGRLGFLVPAGGGVVLLILGVMGGGRITPGEGDVDALESDKDVLEEVDDGELDSEVELFKFFSIYLWPSYYPPWLFEKAKPSILKPILLKS